MSRNPCGNLILVGWESMEGENICQSLRHPSIQLSYRRAAGIRVSSAERVKTNSTALPGGREKQSGRSYSTAVRKSLCAVS
jgi:hypothetical protein